jgi:hypothetical protein
MQNLTVIGHSPDLYHLYLLYVTAVSMLTNWPRDIFTQSFCHVQIHVYLHVKCPSFSSEFN